MGHIISHRGRVAQGPPDNTVQAFDAALRAGAEGVETDVRLDRNGEAILFHDATLPDGRPVERTSRAEISVAVGHEVAAVDEALRRWPNVLWNLEIKAPDAVPVVRAYLARHAPAVRVLISSFHHAAMVDMRSIGPCDTGWLFDVAPRTDVLERATGLGIDVIVAHYRCLDDEVVDYARYAGLRLWTYGAATPAEHRQCFAWDLTGVITDHIEIARAARDQGMSGTK